ncbi:uncharacterized protein J8A68_000806 [[Candida] subhashii]|uniref:Uncharacterized protein n=1 Tax=[Candida] subhashii TaxID=561895 RepID=A0A8J5V0V0_9ASCO|nr:uncharacterized protein J8A68_000806 [[Candida] subhashii]KAG7665600.1 hypothetical protein J8A68_000806 [[Candida] subhashii]
MWTTGCYHLHQIPQHVSPPVPVAPPSTTTTQKRQYPTTKSNHNNSCLFAPIQTTNIQQQDETRSCNIHPCLNYHGSIPFGYNPYLPIHLSTPPPPPPPPAQLPPPVPHPSFSSNPNQHFHSCTQRNCQKPQENLAFHTLNPFHFHPPPPLPVEYYYGSWRCGCEETQHDTQENEEDKSEDKLNRTDEVQENKQTPEVETSREKEEVEEQPVIDTKTTFFKQSKHPPSHKEFRAPSFTKIYQTPPTPKQQQQQPETENILHRSHSRLRSLLSRNTRSEDTSNREQLMNQYYLRTSSEYDSSNKRGSKKFNTLSGFDKIGESAGEGEGEGGGEFDSCQFSQYMEQDGKMLWCDYDCQTETEIVSKSMRKDGEYSYRENMNEESIFEQDENEEPEGNDGVFPFEMINAADSLKENDASQWSTTTTAKKIMESNNNKENVQILSGTTIQVESSDIISKLKQSSPKRNTIPGDFLGGLDDSSSQPTKIDVLVEPESAKSWISNMTGYSSTFFGTVANKLLNKVHAGESDRIVEVKNGTEDDDLEKDGDDDGFETQRKRNRNRNRRKNLEAKKRKKERQKKRK